MLPSNLSGPWYDDPGTQSLIDMKNELSRSQTATGLLIAGLVVAISILITSVTSAVALSQSIPTANLLISWLITPLKL